MALAAGLIATPIDDAWAKTKAAKHKAKTTPPVQINPVDELEIIIGEAIVQRAALGGADPDGAPARQKLAELALRAARSAERALSRGDENLFSSYRQQIQSQFEGTLPGLEKMSARGVGAADYALGTFALHGILEERNVERACARFAAALGKGFSGAKFRHAQCIEESDPAGAYALLREAADSGHVAATERLGRICLEATPPDAACAFARLERAAKDGRASARTLLGWMYAEGIGGKVDLARAAKYYSEAAKMGEAAAHNNLGELYEKGRGVAKDPRKAFEHYLSAADAGFPPAQFNVGRLYAAGKGTPQDLAAARRWFGAAANAGIIPAQRILEALDQETK
ncbi:MAG: sel1 repeat family protein [Sulfuritalea sp.]|jgi:hypothetical protein|nr:sel1 repeat family protein [Sulfuritalea sp.]